MCFVWTSEQKAIISLQVTGFHNRKGARLLLSMGWIFMYSTIQIKLKL